MRTFFHFAAVLAASLSLAGCGALPDKPVTPTLYDFGPVSATETAAAPAGAPLVIEDVQVNASLDSAALLYRLAYADLHQLRPYAYARWSAPPAQLLRQRLREQIGRERPVLDASAAAALARRSSLAVRVLRVELEEFTHHFDSATASKGLLRLRCSLLDAGAGGERLVAQRSFTLQRPAPTPDAAGGVRALSAAADAAAQDVAAWVQQQR